MRLTRIGITTLSACFALWAATASAQTKPAQQGPLVLQPASEGPVFAPEVKFGWFDSKTGTLIGGYGGWLLDNRLLLGGGADFLVDHNYHDPVAGMGYGGFVAGYLFPATPVFHAGVRALIGFGDASINDSISYVVPDYPDHGPVYPDHYYPDHYHGGSYPPGSTVVQQVHFHDGFFIFEPQATAVVRLSRAFAIDVAGGYRVISGTGSYNGRLGGPSVTVGVRFGPGI
jgi:hypothetical protein